MAEVIKYLKLRFNNFAWITSENWDLHLTTQEKILNDIIFIEISRIKDSARPTLNA